MNVRHAIALSLAAAVGACNGDSSDARVQDAGAARDAEAKSPSSQDAAIVDASSTPCVYHPSAPPAWDVSLQLDAPRCGGRLLGALRCEVTANEGGSEFRMKCAGGEQDALDATLSLAALPEKLAAADASRWVINYRPDTRGDNGQCYYDKGLLAIRDMDGVSLLLGLADTVHPDQNLSEMFTPAILAVVSDSCGEETVNECGLDQRDTRQALRVRLTAGDQQLQLRAGERGEVDGLTVEVHRAMRDTGHSCCFDCGSGASELVLRMM